MQRALEEISLYLSDTGRQILRSLSDRDGERLLEIRIRANDATVLTFTFGRRFYPRAVHTKGEIDAVFRGICESSAYSRRAQIAQGYVTLSGGHRVGLLGSAVLSPCGAVEGMRDIYGLVFRISRDVRCPIGKLLDGVISGSSVRNLLVVGPPCSGKTTVLRSLAREVGKRVQVAVIDEREELFAPTLPIPQGCDLLWGFPKPQGILQALRTLAPSVIVCDEIGSPEEVLAMTGGLRGGVSFFLSAHGDSVGEVLRRPAVSHLQRAGGIDRIALLDSERLGEFRLFSDGKEIA